MSFFRLQTVRAKLTTLVALSVAVTLAILPVLSWQTKKQLVDEVDDRVEEVKTSFGTEVEDDLADLDIAARLIITTSKPRNEEKNSDAALADVIAKQFHEVYPDVDILFADAKGHVYSQLGCTTPHPELKAVPELEKVISGTEFRGMLPSGCESDPHAMPAYTIARPVQGGGAVVLCLPIDARYLHNASLKLGLELALVPVGSPEVLSKSDQFPARGVDATGEKPIIVDEGASTWAVARFAPKQLATGRSHYEVVAALDVTDIRAIVRENSASRWRRCCSRRLRPLRGARALPA